VREAVELLLRGLDDLRVRVADVEAADAACEVDERVAVDVRQRRTASLGRHDRMDERKRRRDHAPLALDDLARLGARDLGPELDRLRHGHALKIQQQPALCIHE
jgi:hypothetical protein